MQSLYLVSWVKTMNKRERERKPLKGEDSKRDYRYPKIADCGFDKTGPVQSGFG